MTISVIFFFRYSSIFHFFEFPERSCGYEPFRFICHCHQIENEIKNDADEISNGEKNLVENEQFTGTYQNLKRNTIGLPNAGDEINEQKKLPCFFHYVI